MAAGFTVETLKIKQIKNQLLTLAEKKISHETLEKTLKIDCELDFEDINWEFYSELSKFEPFGVGNPEPVFFTQKAQVKDIRVLGNDGKHLKLTIQGPTPHTLPPIPYFGASQNTNRQAKYFSAIGFGFGNQWGSKLKIGDQIDIAYTLLVDSWNGEERLQLKIKDLRLS